MAKNCGDKSKKLDGLLTATEETRKATAWLLRHIVAYHIGINPAEKLRDSTQKVVDVLRHQDPVSAKWVVWIDSLGLTTTVTRIASGGDNLVKAAAGRRRGRPTNDLRRHCRRLANQYTGSRSIPADHACGCATGFDPDRGKA